MRTGALDRTGRGRRASPRALPTVLRENAMGYLFIFPAVVLIGVFGVFPVFFTVYVSLFKWRLTRGSFIGLENYVELFGGQWASLLAVAAAAGGIVLAAKLIGRRAARKGPLFLAAGLLLLAFCIAGLILFIPRLAGQGDAAMFDSLRVTIWYSACTVPVQLAAGMLLAVLLTRGIRGRQAFRVVYLMPYIAPTVATAAVFQLLFSLREDSFANQILKLFGGEALRWLQEPTGIITLIFGPKSAGNAGVVPAYWAQWAEGPSLALVSVIFFNWWVFVGYHALIYINGLSAIPRQLYEAAEVDGAGKIRSFFSITVPLLSPTTYFLTLLGVIGTFKAFNHIFVLRSEAALGTVDPVSVEIFFTFFRKSRLGYASAMSLFLFVIVLAVTVLHQRTVEKGVAYGD